MKKEKECPRPVPPPISQFLIAEQTSYGMEYPVGQFGSAVLVVSLPKILPTPSLLLSGGGNVGDTALVCAGTAQQQPKHRCVINTLLASKRQHSTMRAAVGRINSISARPNTAPFRFFSEICAGTDFFSPFQPFCPEGVSSHWCVREMQEQVAFHAHIQPLCSSWCHRAHSKLLAHADETVNEVGCTSGMNKPI